MVEIPTAILVILIVLSTPTAVMAFVCLVMLVFMLFDFLYEKIAKKGKDKNE